MIRKGSATSEKFQFTSAAIAGVLVSLLGFIVIVGWYLNQPKLIQIYPTFAPMQYNTALGFLLSGLGILALQFQRYKIALTLGILVLSIGLLTLLQYMLSINLGIDTLLMDAYITTKTSHPGRMAPNTALCFTLVGMNLILARILIRSAYRHLLLRFISVLILVLGFTAFLGYLAKIETSYGWGNLTRMALHTSIGFLVIGLNQLLLSLYINKAKNTENYANWVAVFIAFALSVLSVTISIKIDNDETANIQKAVQNELNHMQQKIEVTFNAQFLALKRMADRWEVNHGYRYEIWQNDAYNYVIDQKGLVAVEWYDHQLKRKWIESDGADILYDDNEVQSINTLSMHNNPFQYYSSDITLILQNSYGFRAFIPILIENELVGYIAGVFEYSDMIGSILSKTDWQHYEHLIYIDSIQVMDSSTEPEANQTAFTLDATIQGPAKKWQISLSPNQEIIDLYHSGLSQIILICGFVLALLIAALINSAHQYYNYAKRYNRNKKQLQVILDNTNEAIIGIRDDGAVMFCNQATIDLLDINLVELMGSPISKAILLFKKDGRHYSVTELLQNTHDQLETSYTDEMILKKHNNIDVPVELTISNIQQDDDHLPAIVFVIKDITDRYEANQRLEQTLDELKLSNQELENFAYIASNDLKSPLRGIDNLATWLEEGLENTIDETHMDYIKLIRGRISRMYQLLNDILEYSRVGRGDLPVQSEDLASIVKEACEIADNNKNIQFEIDDSMNKIIVNRMPLKQVLENIIGNAVKYHDKDNGKVTVTALELDDAIEIIVSDNGPGIAENFHHKIFQMFQKLTSRDEVEGSGIGLALVKKILVHIGGSIHLDSAEGQGATFTITWPKQQTTDDSVELNSPRDVTEPGSPSSR